MSNEHASPLFLGLDLSTQQLKAMIITENAGIVYESAVNFALDLPQYGTTNGVTAGPGAGEVTSPVAMWVHALDLLLERARASGANISRVVAISGAAQVCSHDNELGVILVTDDFSNTVPSIGPTRLRSCWRHSILKGPFWTSWSLEPSPF